MLGKLYEKWNIRDDTDFSKLTPTDYPILSDLYDLMEEEYRHYDAKKKELYTAELLQEICLGLHSMCKGAESKFFDGHTNITDSSFLTFGVKGLLQASRNVKDAMLFNILSYMSNELLTNGYTAASIDEFYLFLTNLTAVVPFLPRFFKCLISFYRTFLAGSANGKLHSHNRQSKYHQKDQVTQYKRATATFSCNVRKFPDITDSDGTSGRYQDKSHTRL